MVAAVGRANEVGLLEYHFTLIRAMMTDGKFLVVVLIAWLLYALKCGQFMTDKLQGKDYSFLYILNTKKKSFVFARMLQIQVVLLLPIILYVLIAIWIGITHRWFLFTIIVTSFIMALCLTGAWQYTRLIRNHGIVRSGPLLKIHFPFLKGLYLNFISQFIWRRQKKLFLAVKFFSCLLLYGMLRSHLAEDADLKMIWLFYSFALLGHGVLIYRIRQMEEVRLSFYRSLPVSLLLRMLQYAILYLILFIPEIIIIFQMTSRHLDYSNALILIFFGWGILILLSSLLFIRFMKPFDYLKIISGIYLTIFIAILTGLMIPLTICLFLISAYIFFQSYYRFEISDQSSVQPSDA